jgi:hypothetical protein
VGVSSTAPHIESGYPWRARQVHLIQLLYGKARTFDPFDNGSVNITAPEKSSPERINTFLPTCNTGIGCLAMLAKNQTATRF